MPDSSTVGTSGKLGSRLGVDTPIGLISFDWIMPMAAGSVENITWIRPLARSVNAGGAPLYGTCVHVRPFNERKYSAARWVKLPLPADPTFNSLGLAVANFTR